MKRAVIQSRLSSGRLPAKGMLPLGGMPAVLLCARRARNAGLPIVVATSTDASDDPLEWLLRKEDIPFVRGPLDDVLTRFIMACEDLSDDDVVFRLTADNMFPDGRFLQELAATRAERNVRYLATHSPLDGLPYGLSAEVFDVAALREAAREAEAPLDRENVTPWIIRKYRNGIFRPKNLEKSFGHLRCTLDTLTDYLRLCRVFESVADPVDVSYVELVERLAALPGEPAFRVPFRVQDGTVHGALTLGTAQLGLAYGSVKQRPKPSRADAIAIVRSAVAHGVTSIDTARAYGDAEGRVGAALAGGLSAQATVTTKLAPLADRMRGASEATIRDAVDASIFTSCRELGAASLGSVLLHRWEDRHVGGGAAWKRLLELQEQGVIGKLGASVYEPEEALAALDEAAVRQLQIPFNVLDQRWFTADVPLRVKARPEVVVHARSALLQGILADEAGAWPTNGGDSEGWIRKLDGAVVEFKRASRADLCFAYVLAQDWVTSIVAGVDSPEQFAETARLFAAPALTLEECERLRTMLSGATDVLLNPSRWQA